MATAAQFAANRRNALRSTGPTSSAGKARASLNSTRHGLTASPPIERVAAIYEELTGTALSDDPAQMQPAALRLAMAEARLAMVRARERKLLTEGDDALRLGPELALVLEAMEGAREGRDRASRETFVAAFRLSAKLRTEGARNARLEYRRLLRYLREAEREQALALRAWVDQA